MWILLLCVCLPLVNSQCYWNNRDPYPYFGTKTPYDTLRGDFRDVPEIEECEPISIWFMIRHGTRRPSTADTRNMRKTVALRDDILHNHGEGKGEMCAQDVEDLQNWTWNPKLDFKTSYLTSHGYQELFEFGQRFGQKFTSFLEDVSSSMIRPTSEQRTQGSVKAFVQGLQGINRTFVIENHILNDPVARVQENVQRKTGIEMELKPTIIMGMYDLCRFYRSYSLFKRSPWCSVFSDDDLEILEYVEDIVHYFRNGYGKSLNALTGAVGLKDLYEKFQNASQTGQKSFTAYFTHDTMVDMIYTAMGLYKDDPKLSGLERVKDRKWRTSFLTPFAANFVAVLYRIQFLVNEREMHLCTNRVCSWGEFRTTFKRFSNATLDFCDDLTYESSV
ncbi:multiple inositol polyphosphate phosphatase 1-like [Maniola hyperantus]|uniref:multiple inositol polyphosphate phosphatase 1-like n=1 Tax=Aphantopus hyperantus TaxID=2795564 RepID=UPI00156888F9|nr:multiple inositol polyphosphate phosphatase 1-like [Maniola hyperantus]